MRIVKDKVHPNMYRIKWPDGVLSADFYNKTRARDISRHINFYLDRTRRSSEMSDLSRVAS